MKKILVLSASMVMLGSYAANADSFYLGVGNPPPPAYYVAPPPPAYVVEPGAPVYYYDTRPYPYYYRDRHHHYDWNYWRNHRGHERREEHDRR